MFYPFNVFSLQRAYHSLYYNPFTLPCGVGLHRMSVSVEGESLNSFVLFTIHISCRLHALTPFILFKIYFIC